MIELNLARDIKLDEASIQEQGGLISKEAQDTDKAEVFNDFFIPDFISKCSRHTAPLAGVKHGDWENEELPAAAKVRFETI